MTLQLGAELATKVTTSNKVQMKRYYLQTLLQIQYIKDNDYKSYTIREYTFVYRQRINHGSFHFNISGCIKWAIVGNSANL